MASLFNPHFIQGTQIGLVEGIDHKQFFGVAHTEKEDPTTLYLWKVTFFHGKEIHVLAEDEKGAASQAVCHPSVKDLNADDDAGTEIYEESLLHYKRVKKVPFMIRGWGQMTIE